MGTWRGTPGSEHRQINNDGGNKCRDIKITSTVTLLRDKPLREPNKINEGHVPNRVASHQQNWYPRALMMSTNGKNGDTWVLPRVLLDDGQGKSPLDMDISSDDSAASQRAGGMRGTVGRHPRKPPATVKGLPGSSLPHKLRAYRSILDLSFKLRLENGGFVDLVNNTTEKWAPRGAID